MIGFRLAISGKELLRDAQKALQDAHGVRRALAHLQKVHKTKVIRRGAGKEPPLGTGEPWTSRTGELSKSFHLGISDLGDWGFYGSSLKRSRIIEEGGRINAKNKPYLVFKNLDGAFVSVKSVLINPHPTLDPAVELAQAEMDKIITDAGVPDGGK